MKIINKNDQRGFVLFITMIMLLIFAIVAISMYQQTSMLTKNVQQDLFKKQAEAVSMEVLKQVEESFPESIMLSDVSSGITSISGLRDVCDSADTTSSFSNCNPIPEEEVEKTIDYMKGVNESAPSYWSEKTGVSVGSNTTGDALFTIQQLGADVDNKYYTFRTTVVSNVLTASDAISSTYVIPIVKYSK